MDSAQAASYERVVVVAPPTNPADHSSVPTPREEKTVKEKDGRDEKEKEKKERRPRPVSHASQAGWCDVLFCGRYVLQYW